MILSNENLKPSLWLAAKVAGALFIGYCIYFDRKRTTASDYKDKLRERRIREFEEQQENYEWERRNRVFKYETEAGKAAFRRGYVEKGVEHFVYAMLISERPALLMEIYHVKLTARVFDMIVRRLNGIENFGLARAQVADVIHKLSDETLDTLDASIDKPPTDDANEVRTVSCTSSLRSYDGLTSSFAGYYL